jgi:allantoate deiminase
VGIVNGIAGLNWFEVVFEGQPNHAGATPMHLRKDPMAAAGVVIAKVGGMARSVSSTTVATGGKIKAFPNIPNIIPGRVSFVVDIRDALQENIDNVAMQLKSSVIEAAEDCNVSYSIEKIASNHCVAVPQYLVDIMVNSACKLRLDYELMPSGAVHDASNIADICDVGMIFLPSIGGRSHVPEENTEYTDIKAGADLLLAVLLKLAI